MVNWPASHITMEALKVNFVISMVEKVENFKKYSPF